MLRSYLGYYGDRDRGQGAVAAFHGDGALNFLQGLGMRVFVPDANEIFAGRNAGNGVAAGFVGNGEEIGIDGEDDTGHLRVDVAEEIRRAGAVEANRALCAGLVEAEVEAFSAIERENVVEPGVGSGEVDDAADGNDE